MSEQPRFTRFRPTRAGIAGIILIAVSALWVLARPFDYDPARLPQSASCMEDLKDTLDRAGHLEDMAWRGCLVVTDTARHFARYATSQSNPSTAVRSCIECHDGATAPTFASMWTYFPRYNVAKQRVEDFAQAIQDEIVTRYNGTIPVRSDVAVSTLYVYAFFKASQAGLTFAQDTVDQTPISELQLQTLRTTDSCRRVFAHKGFPRGPNSPYIVEGCNLVTDTHNHVYTAANLWRTDMICENCHLDAGTRPFAGPLAMGAVMLPIHMTPLNKPIRFDRRILMCFARSLNWFDMGRDAPFLTYVRMYANWLAQHDGLQIGRIYEGRGIPMLYDTDGAGSSILAGEKAYQKHCIRCHGKNAWGGMGPVYNGKEPPPIAGPNSFTALATTASRNRLAGFILNNMPPGASHDSPILSEQQALDVAIYIESLGRPADFVKTNRLSQFGNYLWLNAIYHGARLLRDPITSASPIVKATDTTHAYIE